MPQNICQITVLIIQISKLRIQHTTFVMKPLHQGSIKTFQGCYADASPSAVSWVQVSDIFVSLGGW